MISRKQTIILIAVAVLFSLIETVALLIVLFLVERFLGITIVVTMVDYFFVYPYETGGFYLAFVLISNIVGCIIHILYFTRGEKSIKVKMTVILVISVAEASVLFLIFATLNELEIFGIVISPTIPNFQWFQVLCFFLGLFTMANFIGSATVSWLLGSKRNGMECCADISCIGSDLPLCSEMEDE